MTEKTQSEKIKSLEPGQSIEIITLPEDIKDIAKEMESEGKVLNWISSASADESNDSFTLFLY